MLKSAQDGKKKSPCTFLKEDFIYVDTNSNIILTV